LLGDRGLLVELGDDIHPRINQKVRELYMGTKRHRIQGIKDLVPSYRSMLVVYDPLALSLKFLKSRINDTWSTLRDTRLPDPRTVEIPVVYGDDCGPDLQWIADYHKITAQDVIRLHTQPIYQVYMIGFMPGYPYMGEIPDALVTPRRKTPRTHVLKGSVAIAQKQTGIYPFTSPGGWQILGRTPVQLFDSQRKPPSLLEMGDQVKFYAIAPEESEQWRV
jgi:KipI family sensor histidine kinase inhibitor